MTAVPHIAPDRTLAPRRDPAALADLPQTPVRLWRPKRILVARDAADSAVAERAVAAGRALGAEIVMLSGNRLTGLRGETEADSYRRAKTTLAIVNAPASARTFQPIPPSADFRIDLAVGCPAHCQYCYLAGSLTGPPVTRVYANISDILAAVPAHVGRGTITSAGDRAAEGTTFEASCYTDPLGIEHLTGSLSEAVAAFGRVGADGSAGLRFTTKYDAVEPLLAVEHGGRTRARFSVNAEIVTRRFEGGTAPLAARLAAMGRMARAGYPVGLTVAPIMPLDGWREAYDALLAAAAAALPAGADVTVELITHRFTPGSREVLLGWYPATGLEMDPAVRVQKRGKFGNVKYVYPKALMADMKGWFAEAVATRLPSGALLYFT